MQGVAACHSLRMCRNWASKVAVLQDVLLVIILQIAAPAPHCGASCVQVNHEDFNEGIIQVQAKKKANLSYYA